MKSLDDLIAEAKLAKKTGKQRTGAGQEISQQRQSNFIKKGIQKNKSYLHDDYH